MSDPSWDDIMATALASYRDALVESIMRPGVLLNHISPEWQAERARLDAIGPEHHPDWHDLCEVRLEEFKPKFRALMEEYGAELSSYDEIDIHLGSAWWNWSEDSYPSDG